MQYIGIDIGKERHAASGIDDTGRIVLGAQFFAADAGGYASLTGLLRKLGPASEVLAGMESTGHYGKLLAHKLREDGWTVHVFNPAVTAAAAKGDLRGRKTDKLDAQIIAHLLRDGRRGQAQSSNSLAHSGGPRAAMRGGSRGRQRRGSNFNGPAVSVHELLRKICESGC